MSKYRYNTFFVYILLTIVVLATIAITCAEPLSDGDIWFHLAYGRYFLENHTLIPDHTIFSWTPTDNGMIYCAWIPQIILLYLYQAGGLDALYALRYLFIIIFGLLLYSLSKKNKAEFFPATLLICLSGILMSRIGLFIKAELFSFLLMSIIVWTWLSIKIQAYKGRRLFYLFPLIILIWVNSHGGFIFGIVFLGLILCGEIINYISGTSESLDHASIKHLLISILLSFFAVLITPYGWNYPIQLINDLFLASDKFSMHMKSINAYSPIYFSSFIHLHYIDYLISSAGILIFLLYTQIKRHKIDWALILVNALFIIIYIRYVRATYYWAIIFVFSCSYLINKISQDNEDLFANKPLRTVIKGISVFLMLFFALRAQYDTFLHPTIGFNNSYSPPTIEAEYIRTNFPYLRIGNDYMSGSYLLWSLWPQKKVLIDARYFPYHIIYGEYLGFTLDGAQRDLFIKKYECDLWCIGYEADELMYFVQSPEWKLVYYGPSACIFLSNRADFPKHTRSFAESIYKVGIFKSYNIMKVALAVGDIEVAKKSVLASAPNPLSPQQARLAINARLHIGNNLLDQGNYYDSIEVYSDALRVDQKNLLPYHFWGTHIDTDLALVHQNLGYSLMKINQFGEAVREYNKALELKPDLSDAQRYLSFAMDQITKMDKSISDLKDTLKTQPNNKRSLRSLAVYYSMKGQYDNALEYLIKILSIDPENAEVYYNIACIYSKQNRLVDSRNYLDKAIKMGFNDWTLLKKDYDLNNIRNSPYYMKLIGSH